MAVVSNPEIHSAYSRVYCKNDSWRNILNEKWLRLEMRSNLTKLTEKDIR